MIQVFFALPLQLGPSTYATPFNGTPATSAAEVTNAVEWITLN